MSKPLKIIITVTVFLLLILFFVFFRGKKYGGNANQTCIDFDSLLTKQSMVYFSNNLPELEGEIKSVSIQELVMMGLITLEDLKDIGSNCTGIVNVTKSNEEFLYSNDVTCGTCSTESLYTAWSEWMDEIPYTGDKKVQIQTMKVYNYGSSEAKYTAWSEWTNNINSINDLNVPNGTQAVDTQTESKTQYSYRSGSFKWFKPASSSKNYYNNGAYSETQPASGYIKDEDSKKVSRTATDISSDELGWVASEVDGYTITTDRYKYTKTTTNGSCSQYGDYYNCVIYYKEKKIIPGVFTTERGAGDACYIQAPEEYISSCKVEVVCSKSTCGYSAYYFKNLSKIADKKTDVKDPDDSSYDGYTCTKNGKTYCKKYNKNTTTYYLTADGTETTLETYLTDAEYNSINDDIKEKYTKSDENNPTVSSWTKGDCPSNLDAGQSCKTSTKTEYKIYSYKWYKITSAEKVWWNNGEYSSTSPGNGWNIDTSSAKWDEWSEFSDTKVNTNSAREVRTQTLKRMRKAYISTESLALSEWLPLEEFQNRVGKTLYELESNPKTKVQSKMMYRYRTLIN